MIARTRVALSAASLAVAAAIFRPQLAQALVVRGDDLLAQNRLDAALLHYRRALFFEPASAVAVDRYAFAATQRRSHDSVASAIAVASAYLRRDPRQANVLEDRALCFLILHRYDAAAHDFSDAARVTGSRQQYLFAAWAALRAGRASSARAFWRTAMHRRPFAGGAR